MKLAIEEKKPVVDVDGSYVYRKYKSLVDAGECFALPPCPSPGALVSCLVGMGHMHRR